MNSKQKLDKQIEELKAEFLLRKKEGSSGGLPANLNDPVMARAMSNNSSASSSSNSSSAIINNNNSNNNLKREWCSSSDNSSSSSNKKVKLCVDISQKALEKRLDTVVSTVVSNIGVNVNTASVALLRHISGLNKKLLWEFTSMLVRKECFGIGKN